MKIYRVSCEVTDEGVRKKLAELEVNETNKCYVSVGTRINKEKIMKVDTGLFLNGLSRVYYETYCLEGDQEKAYKKVHEAAIAYVHYMADRSNKMLEGLKKIVNR